MSASIPPLPPKPPPCRSTSFNWWEKKPKPKEIKEQVREIPKDR